MGHLLRTGSHERVEFEPGLDRGLASWTSPASPSMSHVCVSSINSPSISTATVIVMPNILSSTDPMPTVITPMIPTASPILISHPKPQLLCSIGVAPDSPSPISTPPSSTSPSSEKVRGEKANLFVNYLPSDLDDQKLLSLFSPFGAVESVKVMLDLATGRSRCFGFVRYSNALDAHRALLAMNGYKVQAKTLSVRLANSGQQSDYGTPSVNVYVKGLPVAVTSTELRALFSPFGAIVEIRVMIDALTSTKKGTAFLRYSSVEEATRAVEALQNCAWQGTGKPLVVRFADTDEERQNRRLRQQRKRQVQQMRFAPVSAPIASYSHLPIVSLPPPLGSASLPHGQHEINAILAAGAISSGNANPLQMSTLATGLGSYMDMPSIAAVMPDTNLFIRHLPNDSDEALLYRLFSPFGAIQSVKVIVDTVTGQPKGYGFVKMSSYSDAVKAIQAVNGKQCKDKILIVTFAKTSPKLR